MLLQPNGELVTKNVAKISLVIVAVRNPPSVRFPGGGKTNGWRGQAWPVLCILMLEFSFDRSIIMLFIEINRSFHKKNVFWYAAGPASRVFSAERQWNGYCFEPIRLCAVLGAEIVINHACHALGDVLNNYCPLNTIK